MTRLLLVPVLLLIGGLVAWLDGRHLIPERLSPAFPERWRGHLVRLVALGGLLVAAMVLAISPHLWSLGLALTAAALLVAHFPVRRAAYDETWGLGRYLAATVRRGAAFFGFWLLLAVTPQIIVALPDHRWIAAATLGALLLGGLHARREIVLRLVRATPLEHLPEGFAQVLARAEVGVPVTAYRAGATGELWADSFALPALRGHAVVIGDALIATLDPDALTAVFAREVARLERWTPRRLRQVDALAAGLVAVAAGGGVGLLQHPAESAALGAALWGGGLVLALAIWIAARGGDERVADLRTVALCGDAPALVRALTVAHAVRRIPRRLSPFDEETSTRPSLARRLQAVRQAAGIAPATLPAPVVLSSPGLDRVVVLDVERAYWLEGVAVRAAREPEAVRAAAGSARSLAYRQLTDLRLVTGVRGGTWLKATHGSGRSWRTPIRAEDVAAAQAALDVVDERLAVEPGVTRRRAALLLAFAAAAAATAWARVGVSPVILLAVLVAARPRQAPGWLVGLLIVVWALQEGAGPEAALPPFVGTLAPATMVAGALAFVVGPAVRRRAALRPTPRQTAVVAGGLAAFAVVVAAGVLWVARSAAASIPDWRHEAVALALLAAAAVVALGHWRRRWIMAAAVAALGVAVVRWGAVAVAAWAPLVTGTPLAVRDAPPPARQVVPLDPSARRLALSPSGGRFAVRLGRARANMPYDTLVGRLDGPPRHLAAYDLAFLDEATALVVGRAARGLELRTVPLDPSALFDPSGLLDPSGVRDPAGWSLALPAVYEPWVSVDTSSRVWTVVGWHPDEADAISIAGRIGEDARVVKRWFIPGADANAAFFYLPAIETAFSVTRATLSHGPALLSGLAGVPAQRWELWKLDGKGGASLAVTAAALLCLDPLPSDAVLLCLARYAAHTVIWSVDGRSGAISELGAIGAFRLARLRPGHLRLVMADGALLEVPRAGRPARRFAPAAEPGDIVELDSAEDHVAVLLREEGEVRLALLAVR